MKTYGLELEFFLANKAGEFVAVPEELRAYADSCGYLVEARSEKHSRPLEATHLLQAQITRLLRDASKLNLELKKVDLAPDFPKELKRTLLREHGKNAAKSYFAHGGAYKHSIPRAGLHIHFGTEREIKWTAFNRDQTQANFVTTVCDLGNIPRIIWFLDREFKDEIKAAKRIPGEYEVKTYGFEYRSLPATVDLNKVVSVLETMESKIN